MWVELSESTDQYFKVGCGCGEIEQLLVILDHAVKAQPNLVPNDRMDQTYLPYLQRLVS